MRWALLVALTGAGALAAQTPVRAHAGLTLGSVRFAHRDGGPTADNGLALDLGTRGTIGRWAVSLQYGWSTMGGGRRLGGGGATVDYAVRPQVQVGLGYRTLSDSPGRRWWSLEVAGTATLAIPATPFAADVRLGLAPIGSVSDSRGFGGAWTLALGIATPYRTLPVRLRLGYRLYRLHAGTLADAEEHIGLSAEWLF